MQSNKAGAGSVLTVLVDSHAGGCVAVWVAGWMAVGEESRRIQLRSGRHGDGRGGAILWRGDHRY